MAASGRPTMPHLGGTGPGHATMLPEAPVPVRVHPASQVSAAPSTVAGAGGVGTGAGAGAGAGANAAHTVHAADIPKRTRSGSSSDPASSRMDGKRARTQSPAPPSKVLFVRRLPPDTTEAEISELVSVVEPPTQVLLLVGKNMAFVEMRSVDAAMAVVHSYKNVPPQIRRWNVFLEYSRRTEITQKQVPVSPVLLVSVAAAVFPTTIETMHKILSQYGDVLRIIMFERGGLRFLCELNNTASASRALSHLNGQYIFQGAANLMHVQFSSNTRLQVKYNNDRMRDFTNPSLPAGDSAVMHAHPMRGYPGMAPHSGMYDMYGGVGAMAAAPAMGRAWPGMDPMSAAGMEHGKSMGMAPMAAGGTCVLIVSGFTAGKVNCDTLFKLFGVYGDVMRVKILFNKQDTALVQLHNHEAAETARKMLRDCPLYGATIRVNHSKKASVSAARDSDNLTKDYTSSREHRFCSFDSKNLKHRCPPSRVLHLANLREEPSTEAALKTAFSQFGSVTRFKFFTTTRSMALIEMASVDEAVAALIGLHNSSVASKSKGLKVSFSRSSL